MRRREVLSGAAGLSLGLTEVAIAQRPEWAPAYREWRERIWREFPYERIEVPGADALAEWRRLKAAGRGTPIVIGGDEAFVRICEQLIPDAPGEPGVRGVRTTEEILTAADALQHPEDLRRLRVAQQEHRREYLLKALREHPEFAAEVRRWIERESPAPSGLSEGELDAAFDRYIAQQWPEPQMGVWPTAPVPPRLPELSATRRGGGQHVKVHIVLVPAEHSFEAPAYLKWGAWNDCPAPEYHVAAMRSWSDRYGAELVGMSGDIVDIEVARRPTTRAEALALAREHYDYCYDIMAPRVDTLSWVGAALMADRWWSFWWD